MAGTFKNKTFALLLAALFGALGIHRFYLGGRADPWGWIHLTSLPLSATAFGLGGNQPFMFLAAPLLISSFAALIEALALGLSEDDKWDATYNSGCSQHSDSGWLHALLLVLIAAAGAIGLIAAIARTLDLWFTGGAYG